MHRFLMATRMTDAAVGFALVAASTPALANITKNVKVPCPAPCNAQCLFEISSDITAGAGGGITKVKLCHKQKGTPQDRCKSNINPGKSTIKWKAVGGAEKTHKFDPDGANNVAGDRNNVNDFIKDLEADGWMLVDGVNCMEFMPAGGFDSFDMKFQSILICTCENADSDGNSHYNTRTTEYSGTYAPTSDPTVRENFDPGTVTGGVFQNIPDDYGSNIPNPVLPNNAISPAERIHTGQVQLYDFFDSLVPRGLNAGTQVTAWNIRDAALQSQTDLFINGMHVPGAWDRHDLDENQMVGVSQGFFFPGADPFDGPPLGPPQPEVAIGHFAGDGQFIGVDFVGVNFDNGIRINEIRVDEPGTDLSEYVELRGPPGVSLDGLTYLVIGDGAVAAGSGVIEAVVTFGPGDIFPVDSFFLIAEDTFSLPDLTVVDKVLPSASNALNFENSDNVTHLLVRGFMGAPAMDLDLDNDGVLDSPVPWSEQVDLVALIREHNPPTLTELHYGPPYVGPDDTFQAAHAWKCEPDASWRLGDFDLGAPEETPGSANDSCNPATGCVGDCAAPPDGSVTVTDLLALLAQWGAGGSCDLDNDGDVDVNDLLIMLAAWGVCP
jgi:hypothetical protein